MKSKYGNYFKEALFVTAGKVLSIQQVEMQLKNRVSPKNFQILLRRLTEESTATKINGFSEQEGVLYFYMIDGYTFGDQDIDSPRKSF